MGMWASGDIFQEKLDKLLGDIEGVKMYFNDILVLSEDLFRKHIEQLKRISGKVCAAGLNVDAPKWSFGLNEISYIGYVITRDGIKPDRDKSQVIMDPGRPATTIEVRALISIIQYYQYMCPKQSHVLAPLIEASSGPKCKTIVEWHSRKLFEGNKAYGICQYAVKLSRFENTIHSSYWCLW